ncbi:bacteriocin biosynthesis cyclodehydratase domain-containing protein [Oxalobacteraceae bacterium GrIS 1.11]
MNQRLFVSPLAEITTLGEDKIAISVVGRRYTIEDPFGMIRNILESVENGLELDVISAAMSEHFPADAVQSTLKSLVDTKVLVARDGRSHGDATHEHLEHRRQQDGTVAADAHPAYAAANWRVALAGEGALADALAAALIAMQVPVERIGADLPPSAQSRQLMLVCADFENFGLFRKMNQKAVENNMASLYVGIDWTTVQCGPLVIPKATACYECYFHRMRSTRKFVAEFDVRSNSDNILYHALPSRLAVQWAVAEASRVVLQYLSGTLDNLHQSVFSEINTLSGEIGRSMVLRLPRCPVCGNASTARPVGTVFQHALLRRRA